MHFDHLHFYKDSVDCREILPDPNSDYLEVIAKRWLTHAIPGLRYLVTITISQFCA